MGLAQLLDGLYQPADEFRALRDFGRRRQSRWPGSPVFVPSSPLFTPDRVERESTRRHRQPGRGGSKLQRPALLKHGDPGVLDRILSAVTVAHEGHDEIPNAGVLVG